MVMFGPGLLPGSVSGFMTLLQPQSVLMSVASGITKG